MLDPDDSAVSCALIHVRLPASLLSTLSDESRIEIIHNQVGAIEDGDRNRAIAEEDGLTLTIAQDSSVDSFPLEVDKQKKHAIMWYQSSRNRGGEEDGVPQNELRHVGTTHKRYIIEAPSSATNLRRIGERTRRLLEEERKNRKEIVRLDHNDLLPLPKKNSGAPEKSPQAGVKMPHKKIGAKANNNSRKRKRHIASNVDGWMPNVDDLRSSDTTKDGRSNIVRLHGLPLGIKPEQIRKFFHGLNPGLIFVLPSFPHYIDGWDAMYNMDDMNSCMVNRHPSHFRLFAKFTSSPVANAAIERSGESIAVDTNYCKSELTGASISISPVSRSDASFIQKHMVSCGFSFMSSLHSNVPSQIRSTTGDTGSERRIRYRHIEKCGETTRQRHRVDLANGNKIAEPETSNRRERWR
jgi:hypothetical protein